VDRNEFLYAAAISACAQPGNSGAAADGGWKLAVELLRRMEADWVEGQNLAAAAAATFAPNNNNKEGAVGAAAATVMPAAIAAAKPDVVVYTAAMSACLQGGNLDGALGLFDELVETQGLGAVDSLCFLKAMQASHGAKKWEKTLEIHDQMYFAAAESSSSSSSPPPPQQGAKKSKKTQKNSKSLRGGRKRGYGKMGNTSNNNNDSSVRLTFSHAYYVAQACNYVPGTWERALTLLGPLGEEEKQRRVYAHAVARSNMQQQPPPPQQRGVGVGGAGVNTLLGLAAVAKACARDGQWAPAAFLLHLYLLPALPEDMRRPRGGEQEEDAVQMVGGGGGGEKLQEEGGEESSHMRVYVEESLECFALAAEQSSSSFSSSSNNNNSNGAAAMEQAWQPPAWEWAPAPPHMATAVTHDDTRPFGPSPLEALRAALSVCAAGGAWQHGFALLDLAAAAATATPTITEEATTEGLSKNSPPTTTTTVAVVDARCFHHAARACFEAQEWSKVLDLVESANWRTEAVRCLSQDQAADRGGNGGFDGGFGEEGGGREHSHHQKQHQHFHQ
jgi:pentatricopeptide repeat protein